MHSESRDAYFELPIPVHHPFLQEALKTKCLVETEKFATIPIGPKSQKHFLVLVKPRQKISTRLAELHWFLASLSTITHNIEKFRIMENLAFRDNLTKLYNRRYFYENFATTMKSAKHHRTHTSLIMIDIDHFKAVNDTYGHQIGDQILMGVSKRIEGALRQSDIVARYGGEEIVVVLSHTHTSDAYVVAEKVRRAVEKMPLFVVEIQPEGKEIAHLLYSHEFGKDPECLYFPLNDESVSLLKDLPNTRPTLDRKIKQLLDRPPHEHPKNCKISPLKVTISLGIAAFPEDFVHSNKGTSLLETTKEEDLLIYMADKALYRSKKAGRNRTLTYRNVQELTSSKQGEDKIISKIKAAMQPLKLHHEATYFHCLRVSLISHLVSQHLNLSPEQCRLTKLGAALHDIGKQAIDVDLLDKIERLTDAEFETLKTHVNLGVHTLEKHPEFSPFLPVVQNHHERWSGGGYPQNISGTQIPIEARIVSVADAYDAMVSKRIYQKKHKTEKEALAELKKWEGIQFDPEVVRAFLGAYDAIRRVQYLKNEELNLI